MIVHIIELLHQECLSILEDVFRSPEVREAPNYGLSGHECRIMFICCIIMNQCSNVWPGVIIKGFLSDFLCDVFSILSIHFYYNGVEEGEVDVEAVINI